MDLVHKKPWVLQRRSETTKTVRRTRWRGAGREYRASLSANGAFSTFCGVSGVLNIGSSSVVRSPTPTNAVTASTPCRATPKVGVMAKAIRVMANRPVPTNQLFAAWKDESSFQRYQRGHKSARGSVRCKRVGYGALLDVLGRSWYVPGSSRCVVVNLRVFFGLRSGFSLRGGEVREQLPAPSARL